MQRRGYRQSMLPLLADTMFCPSCNLGNAAPAAYFRSHANLEVKFVPPARRVAGHPCVAAMDTISQSFIGEAVTERFVSGLEGTAEAGGSKMKGDRILVFAHY